MFISYNQKKHMYFFFKYFLTIPNYAIRFKNMYTLIEHHSMSKLCNKKLFTN